MENIKEYPLEWVKMAAEQVYGVGVADRTWRKWLRICRIQAWSRNATIHEATLLLTLAYLKKAHPRKAIGYVHVKQQLKAAPISPYQLHEQIDEAFFSQATGRDLPNLIRQVTKKTVSIRTLYRWADKYKLRFGLRESIPRPEIQKWIDIAS